MALAEAWSAWAPLFPVLCRPNSHALSPRHHHPSYRAMLPSGRRLGSHPMHLFPEISRYVHAFISDTKYSHTQTSTWSFDKMKIRELRSIVVRVRAFMRLYACVRVIRDSQCQYIVHALAAPACSGDIPDPYCHREHSFSAAYLSSARLPESIIFLLFSRSTYLTH